MNKFKKAPLLIAALFLVLSSCVNHPRASSSIINGGSDSTVINNSSNNPASSSGGGASSTTSYSVPPVDYDSKWNIDLSLRGAKFRNALQELMDVKQTNTTSYSNCLSLGAKAAAYPTASSSTFVPFYHDATLTTTTGDCNREHTWPDSRGSGKTVFIVHGSSVKNNSSRFTACAFKPT